MFNSDSDIVHALRNTPYIFLTEQGQLLAKAMRVRFGNDGTAERKVLEKLQPMRFGEINDFAKRFSNDGCARKASQAKVAIREITGMI